MNEAVHCPHCEGTRFSVHSDNPETVACVTCGHRFQPASRQAKAPMQAPPAEPSKPPQ